MSFTELALSAPIRTEIATQRPAWLSRALFPFESRFITLGDTRFHYVDEGAGPTLLFLHGGPMSSFMWRHQLVHLRQRYRCVAVDLPGLGLSQTPLHRGAGFAHMADALHAFVRGLALDRFTLIVHATGAPSGLEVAVREPQRVRGVVISNTFAWPLALVPEMKGIVRVVSSGFFRFLVERLNLLARIAARKGRAHGVLTREESAAIMGPYEDRRARAHLANLLYGLRVEAPFFARLEARLRALADTRALLMFGEEDNNFRAGALDRFARLLPKHTKVVLPKAAHFLTEDAPQGYTDALTTWLASDG